MKNSLSKPGLKSGLNLGVKRRRELQVATLINSRPRLIRLWAYNPDFNGELFSSKQLVIGQILQCKRQSFVANLYISVHVARKLCMHVWNFQNTIRGYGHISYV